MNETISYTYLEVGELWILLFENISHVINQMQTKCIFGGDFLSIRIKKVLYSFICPVFHHVFSSANHRERQRTFTIKGKEENACTYKYLHFQWRVLCRWSNALRSAHLTTWARQQEFPQCWLRQWDCLWALMIHSSQADRYYLSKPWHKMFLQITFSFAIINSIPVRCRVI